MAQTDFPVEEIIPELKKILAQQNKVFLQAPPGAGKSTVLPLKLLEESWLKDRKIVMLQPRRLAAISVATRIANTLGEPVGKTVGYRIRFDTKISTATRLEVVTEGILIRMLQNDSTLEEIGMIIFDEFHERSLDSDTAYALTTEIQQILREDLRMLIMSATLNEDLAHQHTIPMLKSPGRQFPVNVEYLPLSEPTLALRVLKAVRKGLRDTSGDLLIFLPGTSEIHKTCEMLENHYPDLKIHALFGNLTISKQQQAILPDPEGLRKIVLATSIAETSLTIEGITLVIDSGLSRIPRFDPKTGLTRLETVKVTRDAAEQRAGRAGRLGPGMCYRLWPEATHQHLVEHKNPEILDSDLSPVVLQLSLLGIKDSNELPWITLPPAGALSQAYDLLAGLKALSEKKITETGKKIAALPTHPRIAHLLSKSEHSGLIAIAIDLAAILEERDPLKKNSGADLNLRMEALQSFRERRQTKGAERSVLERIDRLADHWKKVFRTSAMNRSHSLTDSTVAGRLLSLAYPERVAKKISDNRYKLANGKIALLAENDPLILNEWIIAAHVGGTKEEKITLAAPIDPSDLTDLTDLTEKREHIFWDSRKGILRTQEEERMGEITLNTIPLKSVNEEQKNTLLLNVIRKERESLFSFSEEFLNWQNRMESLRNWRCDEKWPEVNIPFLMNHPEIWISLYLNRVKSREDFLKLDLLEILKGLFPWELSQKASKLAPEIIEVPSGSKIKLKYNALGNAPILSVRLQEIFGLLETPAVNEGKVKVLIHLLSPGFKPVQVTQDLRSFWENTYPEVRKELRVRYPKHFWPDNPWTANAVRGVKKRKK